MNWSWDFKETVMRHAVRPPAEPSVWLFAVCLFALTVCALSILVAMYLLTVAPS